jgi:hypothetical protein
MKTAERAVQTAVSVPAAFTIATSTMAPKEKA